MEDFERVVLIKSEVYIFKIPSRASNRGHRASDWNLDKPDWIGRLRLVCRGDCAIIRLEDKNSLQLFAECPVEKYPSHAVEPVIDSSRYFVIRVKQNEGERSAYLGLGFADRADSFDLNVALTDHFNQVNKLTVIEQNKLNEPELDLKFKEGETIKIHMNICRKDGQDKLLSSPMKAKNILSPTGEIKFPPPPGSKLQISPTFDHETKQENPNNNAASKWVKF